MKGNQTVLTPPNADPKSKGTKGTSDGAKTFAFDRSYWSFDRKDDHFAGQEDLFGDLGKPLLDNAFEGYNNCIFAYGQTGSGKSYSMMGYGEEHGVIPRICRQIFERIDAMEDKHLTCTVEVSYLEIYNERVRDLLNPSTKGNLRVREHPSTGPYVEDLAKLAVRSFPEIENLMDEGNKARTVAATNMNETSSRSHAVFTLTLTQKKHDEETKLNMERVAKISLVDLAGSERATSTGATGARLKEGAEINRSLSTLGRVIAALADQSSGKKGKASLVPYRDSVLTWLLKDSLGGNSLTAMIAAISPADINFEETLSTLRYADSAKRIKNHAVVNEDANARMIRELKEELAQLRAKLGGGGGVVNGSGGPAEESYAPGTPLDKQLVSIIQPDGTIKKVSKAEIMEQLNQSEKLYKDLNQTWEEKLQQTEVIHKEREAALEELGISIEKGFVGLSTPKKMPHLINLSDDPLLEGCLVYNLKPGTTTLGNFESTSVDIRLQGARILPEHCTFENVGDVVSVIPKEGAAVMVNGRRVEESARLRSGYRIILGDFHIFRFNHPQEARAERAEQGSLLRHSIVPRDLESPSPHPGHQRSMSTVSRTGSDWGYDSPRPNSPPVRNLRDSDWSMARREAVTAVLGADQKINNMTDDELDGLFEDLQRIRAGRKENRQSRLFDIDDDTESNSSHPVREKYLSNGTIDNFSLDTALTMPSTPLQGEEDQRLRLVREEMQTQLEQQKEEYQAKLKSAEEANIEMEEIKAEKVRMEESLQTLKAEMEKQLRAQKEQFEQQIAEMRPKLPKRRGSNARQLDLARRFAEKWRSRRYVAMAEQILQYAVTLKEAQIMSQQMDKHVVFQFCIVDVGHTYCSSYDLVFKDVDGAEDEDLELAPKPCLGVRVIDFKNQVILTWSLKKLRKRLRQMRQMHQYHQSPQYAQHFKLENPFAESCLGQYSRIGDVDVPLAAVFEARVQDFSLDVTSPYTSNVIGIVDLSLEPSSAEAPSTTLKFNVVMRDLIGFPEREGSDVHAQLFLPGISDESGATTTSLIRDFDEGPVRFESVHSMSLPLSSPRSAFLRVSVFARITSMHLDKLLSWDDMRDAARKPRRKQQARIPESEYHSEQRHDVFARVQLQEIAETGDYQSVEVIQSSPTDAGAYQLHQGLQRRVVIHLSHNSGTALPWNNVANLRIGQVVLLDQAGKASDLDSPQKEVPLKLTSPPAFSENTDGTSKIIVNCQWDSSMHGSPLLDRPTTDRFRVQVTLLWSVTGPNYATPMPFSHNLQIQVRSRSWIRQVSLLQQFWSPVRVVHSTSAMYSVAVRPISVKTASDLWRMDSKQDYVKGEEMLNGWTPRGVSLIQDFLQWKKQKRKVKEVETVKSVLGKRALAPPSPVFSAEDEPYNEHQQDLLKKVLQLWSVREPEDTILAPENIAPPERGAAFARHTNGSANGNGDSQPSQGPKLSASVRSITKNPIISKSGQILIPDPAHTRWLRRHIELRRPYLHLYSVQTNEELGIINLSRARIDHQPQVARLLRRGGTEGTLNTVFAVFAEQNTFLFACRSERDKLEWIWRIDEGFMGEEGEGSDEGLSSGERSEVDG